MIKAMITGSFDPITKGHEDLIRRASALFDEIYVVISANTVKGGGMFTSEQRLLMADAVIGQINDEIGKKVIKSDICHGLVSEYAQNHGISVIVRGARSATEYEYEAQLFEINRALAGIETIVLPSSSQYEHISSAFARDMVLYGRAALAVPAPALAILEEIVKNIEK